MPLASLPKENSAGWLLAAIVLKLDAWWECSTRRMLRWKKYSGKRASAWHALASSLIAVSGETELDRQPNGDALSRNVLHWFNAQQIDQYYNSLFSHKTIGCPITLSICLWDGTKLVHIWCVDAATARCRYIKKRCLCCSLVKQLQSHFIEHLLLALECNNISSFGDCSLWQGTQYNGNFGLQHNWHCLLLL